MRITPLALAASLLASLGTARGQGPAPAQPAPLGPQPSTSVQALPRGSAAASLPTFLEADRLRSQLDVETVAEGGVDFRRGTLRVRADRVAFDAAQDLAKATGSVRIDRDGARYSGPEMQLQLQRFEGYFLRPEFEFPLIGAGGRAARIDFLDNSRSVATQAEYTSCVRDGDAEPAWLLRTARVQIDLESNVGIAEGAVLRFQGVPILALPALSFPLSDTRRSGWLPPTFDSDNRSGIQLSVPYYWNLAPNRDATLTPRLITRRGLGLNTEFRYLEPGWQGALALEWLPHDRLLGRSREAFLWNHEMQGLAGVRLTADVSRVSDDDWWKDFPSASRSLTSRLLPTRLAGERPFSLPGGQGLAYARVLRWQVLQGSDATVVSPYERSPQLGVRLQGRSTGGVEYALETEVNRFTLPSGEAARNGRSAGARWHLIGGLAYPVREAGWFVVPRVGLNAAAYAQQGTLSNGADRAARSIPSFSLDAGLQLERSTEAFGRALRQTLEPRLLYVKTPYRAQSQLPNYDAAAKDFNFSSIYTDNQFSGVDRVSDAHQLTAGFTTRFVDAASGAEALRLGLVQRYRFSTQRVTAQADGTVDGEPIATRLSDALLLGSTSLVPGWTLDGALQYSPDIQRSVRSIIGARYSPGPYRTVSATYRFTRGLSEQLELGWQWPLGGQAAPAALGSEAPMGARRSVGGGGQACSGNWYAVGRVNYSVRDRRVTDSVLGAEYDAGCWIARVVSERLSTGRSEATTRVMLQLELVGLSRIGSNPLKVLKDNIPGYRLLRDERRGGSLTDDRQTASSYD